MLNRKFFLIFIQVIILGCSSDSTFLAGTPTVNPAIVMTQLAQPIITPTMDDITRGSYDFLPSATPFPTVTPTNIFLPVLDENEYSDLVITLERTMCFGSCPAYSLTIYGNGIGVYEGKFFVMVEGIQEFKLTKKQISLLVEAFEEAEYFSLEDYYSIAVTDMPSVTTSITFQGKSKLVYHYAWCIDYETVTIPEGQPRDAAPQALCALEDRIDEIINVTQWTGK